MNLIAPIFLILASVGIFYGYTNSHYQGQVNGSKNIVSLLNERKQYLNALDKSSEFIEETNKLTKINNELSSDDLERLKKLLPDHIDNVRLIIDIDEMASKYGFRMQNIKIDNGTTGGDTIKSENKLYGTTVLSFSITASYGKFRSFVKDLEKSLRIFDIVGVSFTANDSGNYDYDMIIKTYWVK